MVIFLKHAARENGLRLKGGALVIAGACLWGVSGNVAQYLFQFQHVAPGWMTALRMIVAGALLLVAARISGHSIVKIWCDRSARLTLLIFGLIGMIGAQLFYFESVAAGNAATATLLQSLSPVLILLYSTLRTHRCPQMRDILVILLAMTGVFLIVTHGNPSHLTIAPSALIWGLLSAVGCAAYAVLPVPLLGKWGAALVIGWGMVIGGVILCFVFPLWKYKGAWTPQAMSAIIFVVLFGTLAAFYLYLASLKYLRPIETSLLGCAEPLSAAIVSVLWLHVAFTAIDWIGSACIIGTVVVLAGIHRPIRSDHRLADLILPDLKRDNRQFVDSHSFPGK
ncbi:MAG: EamA family transporter [Sporolactobacillus sp.]